MIDACRTYRQPPTLPAVADDSTENRQRSFRSGATWGKFGSAVGDRTRSAWLNDFMDWVVRDPQLWLDANRIASCRGESLGNVIATQLRRYVARHAEVDARDDS